VSAATRTETIAMPDGGEMSAYLSLPDSGHGPGLLVLMEIFGVGSYIRRAADRLAELGYVAMAPDLFRRTQPGLELEHDEAGLQAAMAAVGQLDFPGAVQDSVVALEHLHRLPEVDGRAGVVGFCLGGSLAFFVAGHGDPAVAVCYYGSAIPDALEQGDQIECPVLFHWGAEDGYIPLDQAQRVDAASAERPNWESHIQPDGGHAFDNHDSEMFYRPQAADRAWALTAEFLARELPVQQPA
jgi:carboxymethylenebutenolidase